jgi:urease accessory protein UreE
MTDGLLENIIQLEKQIQANVAAEQARAGEWQERELAALESSLTEARIATEAQREQALAKRKAQLLREGDELEATAADWCGRLANLDDSTLEAVLKRHLAAVLPGGDHDHPHGQS